MYAAPIPTPAEIIAARVIIGKPTVELSTAVKFLVSPYKPDPARSGIPEKKEKVSAVAGDIPVIMPAIVVIPERDVPGISASIWAAPTITAWESEICESDEV